MVVLYLLTGREGLYYLFVVMTLQELKALAGGQDIGLYNSKTSKRLVGSIVVNGVETRVITTVDFDATAPVYASEMPLVNDEGVLERIYWLSNKAPKAPAVTL